MNYLFDSYSVQAHGTLGALDPAAASVDDGVQWATPAAIVQIQGFLSQLYFTATNMTAERIEYSAVPCANPAGCSGPNAVDTIAATPPGSYVIADLISASPTFVKLIVAGTLQAARSIAVPGSNLAIIQRPPSSVAATATKKSVAGPVIAGAVVGGGLGFAAMNIPGAAVGAAAGAAVGWYLGKPDAKAA